MSDQAEVPAADRPEGAGMTPEQLNEAKRYGREGLVCDLADKALDVVYLALAALLLARPLDDWLRTWSVLGGYWVLRLMVLYLIVLVLHVAVSLPRSFYSGYVLEHR